MLSMLESSEMSELSGMLSCCTFARFHKQLALVQ
jgi:hypothetical protein